MDRVELIKKRHGNNAFKRYGRLGGSPILKAYAEGRIKIVNRKSKKS